MMILALESSATACSVALCRDGELVAQSYQNSALTHSRTLLPMVCDMLKNCDVTMEQVDVVAVAVGPGSFTGLRIGVATAKGLAWPGDKDCAPCSTLESMAWPLAHLEGKILVCAMDARRNQVYNALFLAKGGRPERLTPDRAISLEELGIELKKYENLKIVVGDGAKLCYNTMTEQGIALELAPLPLRMQSAWGVSRAAEERLARGDLVKGGDLVPVYHRLSQAERERLGREKIRNEGDRVNV
ncbi:MAG: tRNA (adenosine(37)-N6)-threonylcarbamoyltransferase complex dimerization subunit type 1 TsaB [Lawsonibacter sp.]|nr:tRNA (adenosine(37)-N6)-threonylcarbamoyltransferase complex dimerization subunit type 1 TsaB [Lawsonibacter sp.]